MDRLKELSALSTFDLAFGIATGKYKSEDDKFMALDIIKERDAKSASKATVKPKKTTPPLKGSKAEKILKLYEGGLTSEKAIRTALTKKNITVYAPEIYRVLRDYTDFKK